MRYRVPRQAVKDGIVYVTEDRKIEGFFETMSIAENIYSGLLAAGLRAAWRVSPREMRGLAGQWTKTLEDPRHERRCPGGRAFGRQPAEGGDRQGAGAAPAPVIFDEPTRGVDVGAIAEIHALINGLADEGLAVVVISSYLPEIMNLSDRILVCRQGRIVEEFSPAEATEEKIMYAAVHQSRPEVPRFPLRQGQS